MGVTAAVAAMVGGRFAGNLFLVGSVRAALRDHALTTEPTFISTPDVPEAGGA
jgi:hypothetical protein